MQSGFARRFEQAWAQPTPEGLMEILHPDVVLYQPHRPPIRGRAAGLKEFTRLLRNVPGLHGKVDRSVEADGVTFIEWRLMLPAGRRHVAVRAVDRFFVRDGVGTERAVYFDQLALLSAVLFHPRLWLPFLKYRLGL